MRTPLPLFALTLTLTLLLLRLGEAHHGEDERHNKKMQLGFTIDDILEQGSLDEDEFVSFCELSNLERSSTQMMKDAIRNEECSSLPAGAFQLEIDGVMIFSLIICALWGAVVRAFIHAFHIAFPYTVILMLSGMLVGAISRVACNFLHPYTALARIPAKILLFTFLPLLIFESAFSIPVHTFNRSLIQILLAAFPGMIISTFITSLITRHYFREYGWTANEGHLFGALISATDPVAVVAILRELGVSEVLSVLIEGESLLNDGVALMLYEIFKELVEAEAQNESEHSLGRKIGDACLSFLKIAGGGPVLGFVCGKLTTFLLSNVYNDPPVEISATIVAAYLTYWMAEGVMGVSGVLAVLLLGLTLKAERTVISPDSQGAVHHFWGILGYLANTVLFMIVGTVITETAMNNIGWGDFWNLLLLYVALHFARFTALIVLYPGLKYFGYGMTWQNMIVMMWGGLRGAVGVSLALDIYRNEKLCEKQLLGSKILFHTAGIVFLTLVINGPTTKPLLSALHLTEVSIGRKEDMKNAVRRIMRLKRQAVRMYALSPKMTDADFTAVDEYCTVTNPYAKKAHLLFNNAEKDKKNEDEEAEEGSQSSNKSNMDEEEVSRRLLPPVPIGENATICPTCSTVVPNEPTTEEYEALTEEGRLKVLRALKVSYTHRNSIGLTTDSALQVLMTDAERTEDKPLQLVSVKSLERYTQPSGLIVKLDKKLKKIQHYLSSTGPTHQPPKQAWRLPFYIISHKNYFETFIIIMILVNTPFIIWEIVQIEKNNDCNYQMFFFYLNIMFVATFTMESFLDLIGNTFRWYIRDMWTILDLCVLVLSYVDLTLDILLTPEPNPDGSCREHHFSYIRVLRFTRILRAFRLLRSLLPASSALLDQRLDYQIFRGIDIARTFCVAVEDTIRFLPQMIENKRVLRVIWDHLERERWEAIHAIGRMEEHYERIAIALKTRNACREVINTMIDTLHEMIDEGLLDQTESDLLVRILELKIKRLWHAPTSLEVKPYDREEELDYEESRMSLKLLEAYQHHHHHRSHDRERGVERDRGVEFREMFGEGPDKPETEKQGKDKGKGRNEGPWNLWAGREE